MKYLCLIYRHSERWGALPASRHEHLLRASALVEQDLRESGHLLCSGDLTEDEATVQVRVVDGVLSVRGATDAARAEQPGGYVLIDARDLNEAIRVASRLPLVEAGYVEVRPIRQAPAEHRSGGYV